MQTVTMIVDLQYGSTGKGAAAAYIAMKQEPQLVISANMPNAGHTAYSPDGCTKYIHKVLPSAIFHKPRALMIGPGAVFCPKRMQEEMDYIEKTGVLTFGADGCTQVFIHENAVVLDEKHRHAEWNSNNLSGIGSTRQGSAEGIIAKISRSKELSPLARDNWNILPDKTVLIDNAEWVMMVREADSVLVEGAQGYSLGYSQHFWPYCTSRDCTPARFLADCAVPPQLLKEVIGVARTYPIRVGGTSGPCYPDQEETSWEALNLEPEYTTVTNRKRRVFTFSKAQIEEAIMECMPSRVWLSFCDYLNDKNVAKLIAHIEKTGTRVNWVSFGPTAKDVDEL